MTDQDHLIWSDARLNFADWRDELDDEFPYHTDEELYKLAEDMRTTEPGNVLEYVQKWLLFQERFNKVLPMLPFYSNIYFDFYTEDLHDYLIAENMTWSQAIVEAALYEAPEVPEAGE